MKYTITIIDDAIYHEFLFIHEDIIRGQVVNGVGHKESKQWDEVLSTDYLRSILH